MAEYLIKDTTLTAIGNAIRGKSGDTALLTPSQMADAITALATGGGEAPVMATVTCEIDGQLMWSKEVPANTFQTFQIFDETSTPGKLASAYVQGGDYGAICLEDMGETLDREVTQHHMKGYAYSWTTDPPCWKASSTIDTSCWSSRLSRMAFMVPTQGAKIVIYHD